MAARFRSQGRQQFPFYFIRAAIKHGADVAEIEVRQFLHGEFIDLRRIEQRQFVEFFAAELNTLVRIQFPETKIHEFTDHDTVID